MAPTDPSRDQKQRTRRGAGRHDWSPESELEVAYVPRSGNPFELEWTDISVSGTKVLIPVEFESDLQVGAPIRLRFGVDGLNFRVNGRVTWCHPTEAQTHFSVGVAFAYLDPTIAEGHPELWVYFNRRKAFRVTPPLGTEVEVDLIGEEGSARVRLVDISATGVSITLPADEPTPAWVEHGLGHKYELRVTLQEEQGELGFRTRAERRFKHGKLECWGMSILEEDERHLGDALEGIEQYVMTRQRQMRGAEE